MSESEEQRPPQPTGPEPDPRRVYPPHEVQARLEVSASGLRRLAGIYERTVGPLPRDDRGRVWPEDAVEALQDARALVREQRAVSIEAALTAGQESLAVSPAVASGTGRQSRADAGAAILEELRALRTLVEEQNQRISELEEAVRTGRELEAPRQTPPGTRGRPETAAGNVGDEVTPEPQNSSQRRSWWRRFFGFE